MAQGARRIARKCQVLAIVVVGLDALFAIGCDECERYGQTRCQGDVLQECIDDGDGFIHNYWTDRVCPVACHAAGGGAACVDSREPVPECAGDLKNGEICFEGAPSGCWDGYLTKGQACGSATHCVLSAECGPICVAGDRPEPRCAQEFFCDGGDALASCICGYLAYRFPCSAGLSCQEMRGESSCLSPAPDPRCGDPAQQYFSLCEGNVLVTCRYGHVTSVNDCASSSSSPGRCGTVTIPEPATTCVIPAG